MKLIAYLCLVILLSFAACGKTDKFSEYGLTLADKTENMMIPAQEAITLPFSGSPEDIPKAAEDLYVQMRRAGRFFGGPLRLECNTPPDWNGKKLIGKIVFPLAPGEGSREYLDRPAPQVPAEFTRLSGGTFSTLLYTGPLVALEAGHQRLRDQLGSKADRCVFMFEDTLKDLVKRYRVRIMARTGE